MEIKILELEKDKARILFVGENHTYMNALADELLTNPDVDVASYESRFHFEDPYLIVTTKNGADAIEAIKEAAGNLVGYCDELIKNIREQA